MEARRTEGAWRGAEGERQAVDAGIELLGRERARVARETDRMREGAGRKGDRGGEIREGVRGRERERERERAGERRRPREEAGGESEREREGEGDREKEGDQEKEGDREREGEGGRQGEAVGGDKGPRKSLRGGERSQ